MSWKNVQYQNGKLRTSESGGGGSSTFAGLDDVSFNNLQNGQVPKYNSATQKWENTNESGGGGTTHQIYETAFSWKRGTSSSTEKSMEYTATQDGWAFARCYITNLSNSYCAIEGYIYDTNAQIIKFMDMDTGIQAYHTWKVAFPVKKGDVVQINTRLDSGTLQSDGIFRFMG